MKSTTTAIIFFFVAAIAFACTRKSAPVIAQRTEQPPPPPPADPKELVQVTGSAGSPSPMPIMGVSPADLQAGQMIYTTSCVKCHQAKPVENWTVDQWKPILKSMNRKAKLDSIQSSQVSVWVYTHAKKV